MRQSLLLIDLNAWGGHRPAYFMTVLRLLTESGYFVYAICANNTALRKEITAQGLKNCTVLELQLHLIDRALLKLLALFDWFIRRINPALPIRLLTLFCLIATRRQLRSIGEKTKVFFMDLNTMLPAVPVWLAEIFLPERWCGLYIAPSYQAQVVNSEEARQRFYAENTLASQTCDGIAVLHPVYCRYFSIRFGQLHCMHLPELVNIQLQSSELINRVKMKASGRTIISLFGSLVRYKNLLTLLESFLYLDPTRYFCLIIGRLSPDDYSPQELMRITELRQILSNNSHIVLDQLISTEGELNAWLDVSDVIFIHYQNHPYSSNFLAKAIALAKPVIVSPGGIMERVVKQYSWEALSDDSPSAVSRTIQLAARFKPYGSANHLRFLKEHSVDRFHEVILSISA